MKTKEQIYKEGAKEYVQKLISTGNHWGGITPMDHQEKFCKQEQERIMKEVKEQIRALDATEKSLLF